MKTIGFLLESTEDVFGQEMLRGLREVLAGSNTRLVCFTGGMIQAHYADEAQRNVLYDLVDPSNVDLLLIAGSVTHFVDLPTLESFCHGFHPIPVVTFSISVDGCPAVVVDDRLGMDQLMDHVLNHHGFRRLGFLGGPEHQQEAQNRRQAFLSRVEEAGALTDPDWILAGDFTRASGIREAKRFLERWPRSQGGAPFEVLVCANDSMAMGFQDTLAEAGWHLPEELAVTGYDDLPASRIHSPPLTTAQQSLVALAREGAALALRILSGETPPPVTRLAPQLQIRESCRCQPSLTPDFGLMRRQTWEELLEETRTNVANWDHLERVRGLSEVLLTSGTLVELMEVLGQNLTRVGFAGFWLSLFENPNQPLAGSRVFLSRQPGQPYQVWPGGSSFPSCQIVPGGWPPTERSLELVVVEALHSRNQRLGYLVLEAEERDLRISGNLRSQISGALQAVLLLEERAAAEKHLIQVEKMAALGSLVAGVAHEINTPLGVAITAGSFLVERAQGVQDLMSSGELGRSALQTYLSEFVRAGEAIQKNLARAAALIASFKNVAADQNSENRSVFNLKDYVEMTLMSLEFQWKNRPVTVNVEGPPSLILDSYPGAVAQVLSNLVQNTLVHAFEPSSQGTITLELEDQGESVLWVYRDDGAGIAPENLPRVFDPFFTTKRGQGGTGLGLHVVYNVVTNILGGTVKLHSQPGKGVQFHFVVPKQAPRETA